MEVEALVERLEKRGVELYLKEGELWGRGPKKSFTKFIREVIVANKAELIEFLRAQGRKAAASLSPHPYGFDDGRAELIHEDFGWVDGWAFSAKAETVLGLEAYNDYEIHQLLCATHTSTRYPPRWSCYACGEKRWRRRYFGENSFEWVCGCGASGHFD